MAATAAATLQEQSSPLSSSAFDFMTDVGNMLKAFIGINFMVVAYAFSNAGMIRGIVGLIVIAYVTEHCCLLLVDIKENMYQPLSSSISEDPNLFSETDDDHAITDATDRAKDPEGQITRSRDTPDDSTTPTQSNSRHPPSYGDIAFYAGGRSAERLINIALILTQFGYCVGYLIFLSQTMHDVLLSATPVAWFVLLPLPILAILAQLSSIRFLGPFSLFANGALLCGFAAVVTYIAKHFHWTPPRVPISSFPMFFGQMTAALEGIGLIIPVQTSMSDKKKFPIVLRIALTSLTLILMVVGILGFATFGADTRSIILLNFGQSPIVVAVKAVLVVGILFTYPLQIIPVFEFVERVCLADEDDALAGGHTATTEAPFNRNRSDTFHSDDSETEGEADIENRLEEDTQVTTRSRLNADGHNEPLGEEEEVGMFLRDRRRIALRLGVVALTAAVAVLAGASFGVFQALVGSMGASVLAYTAPALFHNLAFRDQLSRFTKVKNGLIVAFGILGGIAGTVASIWEMVEIHRGNSSPT